MLGTTGEVIERDGRVDAQVAVDHGQHVLRTVGSLGGLFALAVGGDDGSEGCDSAQPPYNSVVGNECYDLANHGENNSENVCKSSFPLENIWSPVTI